MQLVSTEKPSVAAALSSVLSARKRGDGFFIGSGYIVTSVHKFHANISKALKYAVEKGYIEHSAWTGIVGPQRLCHNHQHLRTFGVHFKTGVRKSYDLD